MFYDPVPRCEFDINGSLRPGGRGVVPPVSVKDRSLSAVLIGD